MDIKNAMGVPLATATVVLIAVAILAGVAITFNGSIMF